MSESGAEATEPPHATRDSAVEEFARVFGVGQEPSRRLVSAGYTTVEAVRALPEPTLKALGLGAPDVARIRANAEAQSAQPPEMGNGPGPMVRTPVDGAKVLDRWMESVKRSDRPKRRVVPLSGKDSRDVLKKWVDGDDRAMEAWIQASEVARPTPPTRALPPAPEPPPTPTPETGTGPETPTPVPALTPSSGPSAHIIEREETVVRWLTDLLDRVKSDQFDPHSLLQEVQDLNRQLYEERTKRRQLDDELEHVKRGSIAVIKYVRGREAKTREQAIQAKDAEIADLKLRLLTAGGHPGPEGEFSGADDEGPTAPSGNRPEASGAPYGPGERVSRETEQKIRDEFTQREQQYIERETELRRRIVQLEGEVRGLRSEADAVHNREELLQHETGNLSATVAQQLKDAEARDRDLVRRENELRSKFEEIRIAAEELERKRAPLSFKEKELGAWEQQLNIRKQAMDIESRRLEQARADGEGLGSPKMRGEEAKRLEDIQTEVNRKEEELRARESFLVQQMEELKTLQSGAAEAQAEQFRVEVASDAAVAKVRSGVRRLDDLLFGGFPPGSQILVNGPAHTGKDVLARLFIAEGLKQGIPAIWVTTDKTYTQIRDEMVALVPSYSQFESKGLVRYVDLYARSLGITQAEPGVRLLSSTDKGVLDQLTQAVNSYSLEFKDKAPTYRLVFESVSTVTAYLDTSATFRFLQPFQGRRKLDGASSYYLLETGMHTESDLQTLEHMMDGSVNLKIDQLKTFLSVRGIASDVQSRAWIGYTFAKKSFSLGSFSLDHIR
jgi:KaiC/GvpD/RAD55 family RecA-like ATPase